MTVKATFARSFPIRVYASRLSVLAAFFIWGPTACAGPIDGYWVGGIFLPGAASVVQCRFEHHEQELRGSADLFKADEYSIPMKSVRQTAAEIEFELTSIDYGRLHFRGTVRAHAIEGTVKSRLAEGKFHLLRTAIRKPADLLDYLGWYHVSDGTNYFVTLDPYGALFFIDFESYKNGALLPAVDGSFFHWEFAPRIRTTARFERDPSGRVNAIVVETRGAGTVTARRAGPRTFGQTLITFSNQAVKLAGVLLTPVSDGPHPAVVVVPGSGHQTRERARELIIANEFLKRGVAVLLYDKRGCGLSTGHWREAGLNELADDAAAAITFLSTHPEIRADRIGLYGISQGGHLTPLIAQRSGRAAFLVNDSGGAGGLDEAEIFRLRAGLVEAGFSSKDVDRAASFARKRFDALLSDTNMKEYERALSETAGERWREERFVGPVEFDAKDWRVNWWRCVLNYEEAASWCQLKIPALVLFGADDKQVRVVEDAEWLRRLQKDSGGSNIEVRVFEDAGHGITSTRSGATFKKGFLEFIAEWVAEQAHRT